MWTSPRRALLAVGALAEAVAENPTAAVDIPKRRRWRFEGGLTSWPETLTPHAHLRRALAGLALVLTLPVHAVAGRDFISVPVTEPQAAMLGGDLYTPRGDGPHPAVILLHGCGGVAPNGPAWAQWLQSEGYAALVLDSFSARSLRNVCGDPRLFPGGVRAADVFAAAAQLKTLGAIDGTRIAAMGFSHGGWTVIAAWRAAERHPDQKLRAMVALYPGGCAGGLAPATAPPLLMLVGGQDDWTPAEPCQQLAESAKQAGRAVSIVLYEDAHHAFDSAHLRGRVYVPVARGGKGATLSYNPKAHEDAEKQVKRFLEANLKP